MRFRLANRIRLIEAAGRVFLVDDDINELVGATPKVADALRRMENGCTGKELTALLHRKPALDLLRTLESAGWLRTSPLPRTSGTIFSRQVLYLDDYADDPLPLQKKLQTSSVGIIGLGGVGAIVLQHLIGAGVERLVLVDGDKVELENLNRQFIYDRHQVGMPKAKAAASYIKRISERVSVAACQVFIDSLATLTEVLQPHHLDLMINAADRPPDIIELVSGYCAEKRIPFISAAVGRHSGTWGPLIVPDRTPCMSCFLQSEDEQMDVLERAIRKEVDVPLSASFGPTNSVIASLLANDTLLFLAGESEVPSFGVRCAFRFETLQAHRSQPSNQGPCECWKGVPM